MSVCREKIEAHVPCQPGPCMGFVHVGYGDEHALYLLPIVIVESLVTVEFLCKCF